MFDVPATVTMLTSTFLGYVMLANAVGLGVMYLLATRVYPQRPSTKVKVARPQADLTYTLDCKDLGPVAYAELMAVYTEFCEDHESWVSQYKFHVVLTKHIPEANLRAFKVMVGECNPYSLTVNLYARSP